MRLGRVVSAFDCSNPSIDRLLEMADLDVLQLDYRWPTMGSTAGRTPAAEVGDRHNGGNVGCENYAPGFLKQLRTLHKSIYLNPSLHVVTSAGGRNTLGCIEAVADYLCEHDDARLPITAIRGDNVFANLEALLAEGLELRDSATGTPLHELRQPLLAAQVELGGGPLSAALDEGTRIVVCGCYDEAAPAVAAATSRLAWSWDRVNDLATVAAAVHLPHQMIEVDRDGSVVLTPEVDDPLDVRQLRDWLFRSADSDDSIYRADVHCKIADFEAIRAATGLIQLAGITGDSATGDWRLRLTYRTGFRAEALFECPDSMAERTVKTLQALLDRPADRAVVMQLDRLRAIGENGSVLVRVCCCSQRRAACDAWVRNVLNFSLDCEARGCALAGSLPVVLQVTEQIWCPIPREAIAVAVETRPAREWR